MKLKIKTYSEMRHAREMLWEMFRKAGFDPFVFKDDIAQSIIEDVAGDDDVVDMNEVFRRLVAINK